jgi:hypothetical protein
MPRLLKMMFLCAGISAAPRLRKAFRRARDEFGDKTQEFIAGLERKREQ